MFPCLPNFLFYAESPSAREYVYVILYYLLYAWTSIGLSASLILTGRKWPFLGVCALFLTIVIGNVVALEMFEATKLMEVARALVFWSLSLSCVGGTIWAFIAASKRKYIHKVMPWCALLLFFAFLGHQGSWVLLHKPSVLVSHAAQLSLIVLPLAAAPLAIAWNRHR